MAEKPIIMSTQSAWGIQNTKPGVWPAEPIDPDRPCKSMTRRVVKGPPCTDINGCVNINGFWLIPERDRDHAFDAIAPFCVEDILWVRETFTKTKDGEYIYRSDPMFHGMDNGDFAWSWTSPLFLPRKASRIFLEVKYVRIERLQDITEEDANAEGISRNYGHEAVFHFWQLWDTLNAKRGYPWERNPWVYVYEFMRLT
jgi:hypothetical protein